jgi:hypothetical protein
MPELDALTLPGRPPLSMQVRAPSLASGDEDMP